MKALPNLAETQLADCILRLGKPGFEAALWRFLRRMAAPDNLIVLAYRDSGPPQVLYHLTDHPPVFAELERTYLSGAYRLDPFYDLHLQRVSAGAYRLRDVAPDAFHRSRYFIEYYDQTTLVDELTFVAYPAPGVSLNICLGRDASSGRPFTEREMETCQRLSGVIVALCESHWSGLAQGTGPADDVAALLSGALAARHGLSLSPRQVEVALLILRGHSTMSIGLRLGLSPQTIKVFRKQLYARCQISSQAELFALMLPLLGEATVPG
ncbi:MAG: helix-turn-helix transcriptional regulator [Pseudorhodobacter sp.]